MTPAPGSGGGMSVLIPQIGLIGAVFYFLILRPQSQARKKPAPMPAPPQKGGGGIPPGGPLGQVKGITGDEGTLRDGPQPPGGARPGGSRGWLKGGPAAGEDELGGRYVEALMPMVWTASDREDFVPEVQAMRRRVEELVPAGVRNRELKLGSGGLRDVEFAVQLLQLVHGRNAAPANILDLAARFERPNLTYLAPAAAGGTWYPFGFMADIGSNEPGISSGIAVLHALVTRMREVAPPKQDLPRREYPPPTAVEAGLEKIWGTVDRDAVLTGLAEALRSLAAHVGCADVKLGRVTPGKLRAAMGRALQGR